MGLDEFHELHDDLIAISDQKEQSELEPFVSLDYSNPEKYFSDLKAQVDMLIDDQGFSMPEVISHLQRFHSEISNKFRVNNDILAFNKFLAKLDIIYNPVNIIEGNFDGVDISFHFEGLPVNSFQSIKDNFDLVVSKYDLSQFNIIQKEAGFVLNQKQRPLSQNYILSIVLDDISVFEFQDNSKFIVSEFINKIIEKLSLPSHSSDYEVIRLFHEYKQIDPEYYQDVLNEYKQIISFRKRINVKTGAYVVENYVCNLTAFRFLTSYLSTKNYDDKGRLVSYRFAGVDEKYTYNNDVLFSTSTFKSGQLVQVEYYDSKQDPEKMPKCIRRELPSENGILWGYKYDANGGVSSRYLKFPDGTIITNYVEMLESDPSLEVDDYYRLLARYISDPVAFNQFYNHLFRYTSDDVRQSNDIAIGEYWQTPDETLIRVDRGQMLGDCDDIAFLMNHINSFNSSVQKSFVIIIYEHAVNVTSRVENGEYVLTRYGTFGSEVYRGDTYLEALNLLLATYDRGGEGREVPVVDRVKSHIFLALKIEDRNIKLVADPELLVYVDNPEELKQIITGLNITSEVVRMEFLHNGYIRVGDYIFDANYLVDPMYLVAIKQFTDAFNSAFFESAFVESFVDFESYVDSSSFASKEFDSYRSSFIQNLISRSKYSNDAFNVLTELSQGFPQIEIYKEALLSLESDSDFPNNFFCLYNNFTNNKTEENLVALVASSNFNPLLIEPIKQLIIADQNFNLFQRFILFFPSSLNLHDLNKFNGSVADTCQSMIFDEVKKYVQSLNQDSSLDLSVAMEVLCKFMPQMFHKFVDTFVKTIENVSLPLLMSRIDLKLFVENLSKYQMSLDSKSVFDFKILLSLLGAEFNKIESMLKTDFFSNLTVFNFFINRLVSLNSSYAQLKSCVDYFGSHPTSPLKSTLLELLKKSSFSDRKVMSERRALINLLEKS